MAGFGAPANGGAVDILFDSEVPRSFTATTRTVISGGQFVVYSGTANVVGSIVLGYIPGSIVVDLLQNSDYANGIALYNAGSNTLISIATRGQYFATSSQVISGGGAVYPISGTIQSLGAVPNGISYSGTPIGRNITSSASGTNLFTLVDFRF
jgi:hypothetical protein